MRAVALPHLAHLLLFAAVAGGQWFPYVDEAHDAAALTCQSVFEDYRQDRCLRPERAQGPRFACCQYRNAPQVNVTVICPADGCEHPCTRCASQTRAFRLLTRLLRDQVDSADVVGYATFQNLLDTALVRRYAQDAGLSENDVAYELMSTPELRRQSLDDVMAPYYGATGATRDTLVYLNETTAVQAHYRTLDLVDGAGAAHRVFQCSCTLSDGDGCELTTFRQETNAARRFPDGSLAPGYRHVLLGAETGAATHLFEPTKLRFADGGVLLSAPEECATDAGAFCDPATEAFYSRFVLDESLLPCDAVNVYSNAPASPAPALEPLETQGVRVYLVGGGRNAGGNALVDLLPDAELEPQPRFYVYDKKVDQGVGVQGAWEPLDIGEQNNIQADDTTVFGVEVGLLRHALDVYRFEPNPVFLIKYGRSDDRNAGQQVPGTATYDDMVKGFFRRALAELERQGRRPYLQGLYWAHGNEDMRSSANANAYYARTLALINGIRADLNAPDLAVVIGEEDSTAAGATTANRAAVRDAQLALAGLSPRTYYADVLPACAIDLPSGNLIGTGLVCAGEKFFDLVAPLGFGVPWNSTCYNDARTLLARLPWLDVLPPETAAAPPAPWLADYTGATEVWYDAEYYCDYALYPADTGADGEVANPAAYSLAYVRFAQVPYDATEITVTFSVVVNDLNDAGEGRMGPLLFAQNDSFRGYQVMLTPGSDLVHVYAVSGNAPLMLLHTHQHAEVVLRPRRVEVFQVVADVVLGMPTFHVYRSPDGDGAAFELITAFRDTSGFEVGGSAALGAGWDAVDGDRRVYVGHLFANYSAEPGLAQCNYTAVPAAGQYDFEADVPGFAAADVEDYTGTAVVRVYNVSACSLALAFSDNTLDGTVPNRNRTAYARLSLVPYDAGLIDVTFNLLLVESENPDPTQGPLLFAQPDALSGYLFLLESEPANTLALYKVVDGQRTRLAEAQVNVDYNRVHPFRARAEQLYGNVHLSAWHGGAFVLCAVDADTPFLNGSLAVGGGWAGDASLGPQGVYYDNLNVTVGAGHSPCQETLANATYTFDCDIAGEPARDFADYRGAHRVTQEDDLCSAALGFADAHLLPTENGTDHVAFVRPAGVGFDKVDLEASFSVTFRPELDGAAAVLLFAQSDHIGGFVVVFGPAYGGVALMEVHNDLDGAPLVAAAAYSFEENAPAEYRVAARYREGKVRLSFRNATAAVFDVLDDLVHDGHFHHHQGSLVLGVLSLDGSPAGVLYDDIRILRANTLAEPLCEGRPFVAWDTVPDESGPISFESLAVFDGSHSVAEFNFVPYVGACSVSYVPATCEHVIEFADGAADGEVANGPLGVSGCRATLVPFNATSVQIAFEFYQIDAESRNGVLLFAQPDAHAGYLFAIDPVGTAHCTQPLHNGEIQFLRVDDAGLTSPTLLDANTTYDCNNTQLALDTLLFFRFSIDYDAMAGTATMTAEQSFDEGDTYVVASSRVETAPAYTQGSLVLSGGVRGLVATADEQNNAKKYFDNVSLTWS